MSIEQVDFNSVLSVEECAQIFGDTYQERSLLPLTGFDVHQEALFIHGMGILDKAISEKDEQQNSTDIVPLAEPDSSKAEEDESLVIRELELARRNLVLLKIEHEIKRNRGGMASWLCQEVTHFEDKLRLFDVAMTEDTDAAHDVLMTVGSLRVEAEASGDLAKLTDYLMLEMKHGLNLYANSRGLATLINDDNNPNKPTGYLSRIMFKSAKKAVLNATDESDFEYYLNLLEIFPHDHQSLKGVIEYRRRRLYDEQRKIDTSNPANEKALAKIFKKKYDFIGSRRKTKNAIFYRELAYNMLLYPEIARKNLYQHQVESIQHYLDKCFHKNQEYDKQSEGQILAASIRAEFVKDTLSELLNHEKPNEVADLRNTYLKELKSGVGAKNIVKQYKRAAQLTLIELDQPEELNDGELQLVARAHANIDLLLHELAKDALVVIKNDPIDESRHRQRYNRQLKGIYSASEEIASPYEKLMILHRLLQIQSAHDKSKDSSYNIMGEEFKKVATSCINNPVISCIIDPDEVKRMCSEIEIPLEANE